MDDRFSRTRMLIGDEAMDRLARARIIVFGVGGVGGAACEALARAGIGAIDVVDDDTVGISNLNRQIVATEDTIGRPKALAMRDRIASINPACRVTCHQCFYLPETADQFDFARYDYVIDCIDTVTAKLQLIRAAKEANTPIICSMGTANKLDPTQFQVADIEKTRVCPLARIIRKEARKRRLGHFKVVFSTEEALKPTQPDDLAAELREGSSARSLPGSVSFVPPVAGFILASEVIKDIAGLS